MNHGKITDDKTLFAMVMFVLELLMLFGFIIHVEEGVNHSKRTDNTKWCAMVMGCVGIVDISMVL